MLEKEKAHGRSKKPALKVPDSHGSHDHPDHSVHIKRLNRVKGQIEGIERMILDRRYCTDIIAQLKAASAALKAVESEVFKSHLRGCVKSVFNGNDAFKAEEKIQEIIKLIY
jgi:DNA-binding FrmR family transcriptional regulator